MSNKTCEICGADIHKYHNSCSKIECMIELTKRAGGIVYTPNNLPIRCFRWDGLMLEHEHGDDPDYLFPIDIEYIAPLDKDDFEDYKVINGEDGSEEEVRKFSGETHALLYANGSIAVTMYETCSAAWLLQETKRGDLVVSAAGTCIGGHLWKSGEWKISEDSLKKISEYLKRKYRKED